MVSLDLPALHENLPAMQQVIPSDARNFSLPRPIYYSSVMPTDVLYADDGDTFIKNVQNFMKGAPFGVSYTGEISGFINQNLIDSLKRLEILLQAKTGNLWIGKIISGNSIKPEAFNEASSIIVKNITKQELTDNKQETVIKKPDLNIKAWQIFFNNSNPVIGKLYSGPIDNNINDALIAAAKQTESIIASKINNKNAIGKLWNNSSKTFITSIADLQNALNLIVKNQS